MNLPLPKTLYEAACIILGFDDFAHAVASCNTAADFSTKYHDTIGRTIRNEFGLWKGVSGCPVNEAPLYYWFHRRGLRHPDDMSTIVLELVWCDHHQTSLNIEVEAAKYKAYWGVDIDTLQGGNMLGRMLMDIRETIQ